MNAISDKNLAWLGLFILFIKWGLKEINHDEILLNELFGTGSLDKLCNA